VDRIYIPKDCVAGSTVSVDEEGRDHLVKSLRVRAGDRFLATDGEGREFLLEASTVGRRGVEARVIEERRSAPGIGRAITLALCPPKGARMETAIEKAVELGVGRIIPLLCARSVVKAESDSARADRWKRIARSAMVQSEQAWSVEIASPMTLAAVLNEEQGHQRPRTFLLAHPGPDSISIADALASAHDEVTLLVGPEGGFTEEEVQRSTRRGARQVTLGATRLRTETAAIVASALALDALRQRTS